jgi:hypothetical protein
MGKVFFALAWVWSIPPHQTDTERYFLTEALCIEAAQELLGRNEAPQRGARAERDRQPRDFICAPRPAYRLRSASR